MSGIIFDSGNTPTTGVVTSFNTRTGPVTLLSSDVIAALGFTPANVNNVVDLTNTQVITGAKTFTNTAGQAYTLMRVNGPGNDSSTYIELEADSTNQIAAVRYFAATQIVSLDYWPADAGAARLAVYGTGISTGATPNGGQRVAYLSDIPAAGVTSFNTRTGAVTLLSADVIAALGFTPGSLTGNNNWTGLNSYTQTITQNLPNVNNYQAILMQGNASNGFYQILASGANAKQGLFLSFMTDPSNTPFQSAANVRAAGLVGENLVLGAGRDLNNVYGVLVLNSVGGGGNVGIGVSGPTAIFQVNQTSTGNGTVTVSGTSVNGLGTQFLNTFKVGDTITVVTTAGTETKTITSITSNTVMATVAFTGTASLIGFSLVGGNRFSVMGNGNVFIPQPVLGGLNIFGYNLASIAALAVGALTVGWNRSGSLGEVDLISAQSVGTAGGFRFYNLTSAAVLKQLLDINGSTADASFAGQINCVINPSASIATKFITTDATTGDFVSRTASQVASDLGLSSNIIVNTQQNGLTVTTTIFNQTVAIGTYRIGGNLLLIAPLAGQSVSFTAQWVDTHGTTRVLSAYAIVTTAANPVLVPSFNVRSGGATISLTATVVSGTPTFDAGGTLELIP